MLSSVGGPGRRRCRRRGSGRGVDGKPGDEACSGQAEESLSKHWRDGVAMRCGRWAQRGGRFVTPQTRTDRRSRVEQRIDDARNRRATATETVEEEEETRVGREK